jgi:hypothetical protein
MPKCIISALHFSQTREGLVGLSGNTMSVANWHIRTINHWSKLITPYSNRGDFGHINLRLGMLH